MIGWKGLFKRPYRKERKQVLGGHEMTCKICLEYLDVEEDICELCDYFVKKGVVVDKDFRTEDKKNEVKKERMIQTDLTRTWRI